MTELFPNLLRAITTDVMLILLLCTMATPKYKSRWVYVVSTAVILIANIAANIHFYLAKNYTAVFYVDFLMLIVIGIALKPLFRDKIMQWCFSYITMLNIYAAVVFLSYILCDYFPDAIYANIYLRLFLFLGIIFVFYKRVSTLYRAVLDYWNIYILPVTALFICFMGYFLGGDIEQRFIDNSLPLLLLILFGLSVYMAIFHSLKTITNQYLMREENQKMQAERDYLQLASVGMAQRLKLMEEASVQNSRAAHDRRHFNNMLLELLEEGRPEEAAAVLKKQTKMTSNMNKVYCENPAVNAAVSHYAAIAEQSGIKTDMELDIPTELTVDSLELSMVVSNLMENAIQACDKLEQPAYIRFGCRNMGRLLFEMQNPCDDSAQLDKYGLPKALEQGHGIGSKSVAAFAKKYEGELIYKIENRIFTVRLLV